MMTDALTLAWALSAGLVLGVVFFGGLWWTIRRGAACKGPTLLFLSSFLLRTGVVLAGLFFVAGGSWQRLLACLGGFLLARLLVMKFAGPPVVPRLSPEKVAGHAS